MTGQYDRKAAGESLTRANIARQQRDPFATIPDDDEAAPDGAAPAPAASAEANLPLHEIIKPADAPAPAAVDTYYGRGLASCGHPANDDGECSCASWPERAPLESLEATDDAVRFVPASDDAARAFTALTTGTPAPAADDEPPAPALFAEDGWPYPSLSAADFAALYTAAAGHIRARGYYAHEVQGYADEPGISITGALRLAALEHVTAAEPAETADRQHTDAMSVSEEAETRLSAVLYIYGQARTRTGISDLSDVHVGWSLGHFESAASGRHTGYAIPTAAYALELLEQAARMFGHIADDTAPVTKAPAPTRM